MNLEKEIESLEPYALNGNKEALQLIIVGTYAHGVTATFSSLHEIGHLSKELAKSYDSSVTDFLKSYSSFMLNEVNTLKNEIIPIPLSSEKTEIESFSL